MALPTFDFPLRDGEFVVTDEVKSVWDDVGYVLVRELLDKEELAKLRFTVENDPAREKYGFARDDGDGKKAIYFCWNHPGNDITGMVARSEKVAGTFEQLLGGEVYHYHTKLIQKEAKSGGAHNWHQDYGYWYENGMIFPDAGSVFIAVDKATKENGCLQVIPRSQKCGRVTHITKGDEIQTDPVRLQQVMQVLGQPLHVEMEPGDALFFHSNVLHRSDQNHSENRRWAYIIAYNRASNNPLVEHHHPFYTPLKKVANSAIAESSTEPDETGKDFFKGAAREHDVIQERRQ